MSELFDSNCLPSVLTDILLKEQATFRRHAPMELLGPDGLEGCREIVMSDKEMLKVDRDGEGSLETVSFASYDEDGWRHYFVPENLTDLEAFVEDLGLEVGMAHYRPGEEMEDAEEAWVDFNIGIPLPTEPFVVLKVMDEHLVEGRFDDA